MHTFNVYYHTPRVGYVFGHISFIFNKVGEVRVFGDSRDAIREAKKQGFAAPIVEPA